MPTEKSATRELYFFFGNAIAENRRLQWLVLSLVAILFACGIGLVIFTIALGRESLITYLIIGMLLVSPLGMVMYVLRSRRETMQLITVLQAIQTAPEEGRRELMAELLKRLIEKV